MQDEALDEVYYFLMERVMRKAREITKQQFAAYGNPVTVDQWILLKKIAEREGVSQKEVSDKTFKEPAAVTRTLDILDKKGFVSRQNAQGDRRKYHLYLTEAGRAVYNQLLPTVIAIRQAGIDDLSEDERASLKTVLKKMYSNLETY